MAIEFLMAFPLFFALFGMMWIALTLFVFYDVLFVQEDMTDSQRIVWVLIVLFLNVMGVVLYLIIVKMMDMRPFAEMLPNERRRLTTLERLQRLKEKGTLTDEEFEMEKDRILGDRD